MIIGRGGETIRDIQDKSGCHVNIVGEAKSQNGQRPVNLIGSVAAAEHAKRLIMEIVESDNAGTDHHLVSEAAALSEARQQAAAADTTAVMVTVDAVGAVGQMEG